MKRSRDGRRGSDYFRLFEQSQTSPLFPACQTGLLKRLGCQPDWITSPAFENESIYLDQKQPGRPADMVEELASPIVWDGGEPLVETLPGTAAPPPLFLCG